MSNDRLVLAIDHGTSGCKAAVCTVFGEILDFAFEPTPITYLPGGGAEQDPHDWWQALIAAARTVLRRASRPPEEIRAVCCSSTFSSTVAVGPDDEPLMNALTWLDSRGAPIVQRLMRGLVNFSGYGLGNILRWVPRTGGAPTLSGKDSLAHLLWVQHERPDLYRRTRWFLESKDYLNLRLTGHAAASFDSAMLFWVTDTRKIDDVRYDPGLIRRLGIDGDKLPPLRRSTDLLGPLRPEVAEELGLPPATPVVVGSPDLQSACVGSGAVRDFEGHIYIGTSSWLLCHVPFKKTDILHNLGSLPSAIPGRYFCANEQDVAGGCLDFLIRNLLFHRSELQPRDPPEDVYEAIDRIAAAVPPGSDKLIFTPWLNGERTPVEDQTMRGGLHNLSLATTMDHLVRAVLEGVALNSRWVLKYVERFTKHRLDPLNIIGGGARSPVWCQIFADVLDRTIRQVEDPIGANARGAAFIAAVALGHLRFQDIPDHIRFSRTFHPDPANRAIYDELFDAFCELYKRNHTLYSRLNR